MNIVNAQVNTADSITLIDFYKKYQRHYLDIIPTDSKHLDEQKGFFIFLAAVFNIGVRYWIIGNLNLGKSYW